MKQMTYLDIRNIVDEALPYPFDFDYTKVSPTDMWLRVEEVIKKVNPTFLIVTDDAEMLKQRIIQVQEEIYQKDSAIRNGQNDGSFDQCNYFVVEKAYRLRNLTMEKALQGNTNADRVPARNPYVKYDEKIGTEEEIATLVDRDAIAEFVFKLLVITKEARDEYEFIRMYHEIHDQVLYHFALTDPMNQLGSPLMPYYPEAIKSVASIIEQNGYENVKNDFSKFAKQFGATIPEIIDKIQEITNIAYKGKKLDQENKDQGIEIEHELYHAPVVATQLKEDDKLPFGKINLDAPQNQTPDWKPNIKSREEQFNKMFGLKPKSTEKVVELNLMEAQAKLDEMRTYFDRQQEILKEMRQLEEVEKSLKDRRGQLAQEYRKIEEEMKQRG